MNWLFFFHNFKNLSTISPDVYSPSSADVESNGLIFFLSWGSFPQGLVVLISVAFFFFFFLNSVSFVARITKGELQNSLQGLPSFFLLSLHAHDGFTSFRLNIFIYMMMTIQIFNFIISILIAL